MMNGIYKEIAEMLPKYPPLALDGALTIRDMRPDLTESELDIVFDEYKRLGGTMDRG